MSATWLRILTLFLALVAVAQARAQAPDDAVRAREARKLFEQGLAQADGEHWSEAATLFERALEQRDSPVIRFNLGAAWVELHRLLEAQMLLRDLENDPRASTELKQSAAKQRESLERRLATLTIHAPGTRAGARVLLNDVLVPPTQLGVALPVDPRLHRLVLRDDERVLDEEQVGLSEGEAREVHLEVEPTPVVVATPAPLRVRAFSESTQRVDVDDAPPSRGRDVRKRRLLWGLGAGALAVAAGVVVGVMLAGRKTDGAGDAFSPGSVSIRVPQ